MFARSCLKRRGFILLLIPSVLKMYRYALHQPQVSEMSAHIAISQIEPYMLNYASTQIQ